MESLNKTILVIDDEEQYRDYLTRLLENKGYEVCSADNGITGEEKIKQHTPDLIITDIVMPDKEGVEFIQNLREFDKSTPIIAISGGNRVNAYSYLALSKKLGANAILAKPFSSSDLLSTINKLLA